jgi:cell division topological specificity factor
MTFFGFGRRRSSAPIARERLRILLEYERATTAGQRDLMLVLREEILAVIGAHVAIDPEKVMVKVDRGVTVSTLEIDIEVPTVEMRLAPA